MDLGFFMFHGGNIKVIVEKFSKCWIERRSPILWPQISPDIKLLDLFLRGYVKYIKISPSVGLEEEFQYCGPRYLET